MRQALLIVDVQSTFSPPEWLIDGIRALAAKLPAIASVELHDEQVTPFQQQLGWHPAREDESLIEADEVFVMHGYGLTPQAIDYLDEGTPLRPPPRTHGWRARSRRRPWSPGRRSAPPGPNG